MTEEITHIGQLTPDPKNARSHSGRNVGMLVNALHEVGAARSIVIDEDGVILAGNATVEAAGEAGIERVRVVEANGEEIIAVRRSGLTKDQKTNLALYDNRVAELAAWDTSVLAELNEEIDLSQFFFEDELKALLASAEDDILQATSNERDDKRLTLVERFGVPPFSVLDARQGYWQQRKRSWLALGIQSELGRGESCLRESEAAERFGYDEGNGLLGEAQQARSHYKNGKSPARSSGQDLVKGEYSVGKMGGNPQGHDTGGLLIDGYRRQSKGGRLTWVAGDRSEAELDETSRKILAAQPQSGTSIFDPVLCELAYRWFCPEDGIILDPFAGGSVRGIVAAKLGRQYLGIDLRAEQIKANEAQAEAICDTIRPAWQTGDSLRLTDIVAGQYDFIFSCPPYFDLEVYSEQEGDLSNAGDYKAFLEAYRSIVFQSVTMLKENRFACFVVGDIRDKKGFYRNFVGDTIHAFQDAGATLYNDAVLVTAVGSLPIRVGKQFSSYRKLGKTHQNVLVFYKGDIKKIPDVYGDVEFVELGEGADEILN